MNVFIYSNGFTVDLCLILYNVCVLFVYEYVCIYSYSMHDIIDEELFGVLRRVAACFTSDLCVCVYNLFACHLCVNVCVYIMKSCWWFCVESPHVLHWACVCFCVSCMRVISVRICTCVFI